MAKLFTFRWQFTVVDISFNGFLFYAALSCAPIVVWLSGLLESTKRGKEQLQMVTAMVADSEQEASKGKWNDLIQDNMFLYRANAYLVPRGICG